jgi:hypothetical protein
MMPEVKKEVGGYTMAKLHVWEIVEVALTAQNSYENPYMQVDVWARLQGPGFDKKVFGFWDGENRFKIRMTATCPGKWKYATYSNSADAGLEGLTGEFEASEWSEEEKNANASRRGIIRATPNGRGLQYADGTKVYVLGDTMWSLFTDRFPWRDSDDSIPLGSGMGFKDIVNHRKSQGLNLVATLAALPNWREDGKPAHHVTPEGRVLRNGWQSPKKTSYNGVKEMKNEGGYPFEFPGKVPGYGEYFPDMEHPNAAYFQYMDRKMNWLTDNGMTVFIETFRRDLSTCWKEFYSWPDSFIRYNQFIFARYHANNCIFSPIHFDSPYVSIPAEDYNLANNLLTERYGRPPFGTLVSCNAASSSYINFGHHAGEAKWITMHQSGNQAREHDTCYYLTEIFQLDPPVPALNGEPYYPGSTFGSGRDNAWVVGNCREADLRNRSQLYGCLLSGGLAGFIYGCEGMWNANNEPEAVYKIWDALEYNSSYELKNVRAFIGRVGDRYIDLIPRTDWVSPNRAGDARGHKGWAYCASTADRSELLLYFEADCPAACEIRSLKARAEYEILFFDPRKGEWIDDGSPLIIKVNDVGVCTLPARPDRLDYGMGLKRV